MQRVQLIEVNQGRLQKPDLEYRIIAFCVRRINRFRRGARGRPILIDTGSSLINRERGVENI
jgi:hypothetical protein